MNNRMKKPITTLSQLIEQVGMLMQVINMQNERMNILEDSMIKMVDKLQNAITDVVEARKS